MNKPLTIDQKKELAKLLYIRDAAITLPEIAAKVGLPEQILIKWAKQDGIEQLRRSELASRREQLNNLNDQLTQLTQAIKQKPEGAQYPDSKQADIISKISGAINKIESEVNLAAVLDTGKGYLDYVRKVDFDNLQLCAKRFDGYVKTLLK